MVHITLVKKVLRNARHCPQCTALSNQLVKDNLIDKIDLVVLADSRDKQSLGMVLAHEHKVERVPFFLIDDQTNVTVIDVYDDFKKLFNTP